MEINNSEFDAFLVFKASQCMVQVHVSNAQEVIRHGTITFHEGELFSPVTTESVKRKMQEQRLDTQVYDPLLNVRNISVQVQGGIWVLQGDWGEMFNMCNIGDLAVLSVWVFFQSRSGDVIFMFRLDGRNVPLGSRCPSIRELQEQASKKMTIPPCRADQLIAGRTTIDNFISTARAQFLIQVRLNWTIIAIMLGDHNCFLIPNDLGNRNIQDFRTRLPLNVQRLTVQTGGWNGSALDPWFRIMSIRVRDAVTHFELRLSWEEVLRLGALLPGDTLSLWLFFDNDQTSFIIRHDGYCIAGEPLPSLAHLMHHPA